MIPSKINGILITEEGRGCVLNLIICMDEQNGIMFNNRRQSRDRAVCEDVLNMIGAASLYTDSYSYRLFESFDDNRVICCGEPAISAGRDDYCFAEDMDMTAAAAKADKLIIYCWNKTYPADRYFDIDTERFELVMQTEFGGSSHEIITKKVYIR